MNQTETMKEKEMVDAQAGPADPIMDPPASPSATATVDALAKRIDAEDLNIYYGSFLAVKDCTVSIHPNKVTALIGSSGCGKSTFLRSLNRMHELIDGARVEGRVLLDGMDIYSPSMDPVLVRQQIGMVFQQPNPFPTMSIYENTAAGLRLNRRRLKNDARTGSDCFAQRLSRVYPYRPAAAIMPRTVTAMVMQWRSMRPSAQASL